jgi:hypothetical protein
VLDPEVRRELKRRVDQAVRARLPHLRRFDACSGCGSLHDAPNDGCVQCRRRERERREKAAQAALPSDRGRRDNGGMFGRRPSKPKPAPKPQPLPSALTAMRRDEFDQKPLGGYAGEQIVPRVDPPPQVAQPFVIEPPNWEQEARERAERGEDDVEPEPSRPPGSAVAEMMAAARERGELEEPRPLGPPVQPAGPFLRPRLPEPDWRQEQASREKQAAADRAAVELARQLLREGS